ncbi:patatin-like phospholipase family protein [Defluviimonas aestuarii]|uniref:patatin-like phospholipase family protein n=1 Tax=Albidovulum aestuarii TaxID=1130726 RepID=UPI00249B4A94|nr:patatin-like phospholipase family protein [Defluviimonas aestuarii]MDI3336117.1 patatin-like phospholipase family protein [Defluviimonas aestuarii]
MSVRRINLALQGGGAHGAFTWGVLDRLLEDETIEIAGISGTSAGALNGAALKAGLAMGGRQGARDNLDWLWAQVGAVGDMRLAGWFRAFLPATSLWEEMTDRFAPFSPAETFTRLFSPYDYGPFYSNPLERVVEQFRFDLVCGASGPAFFVAATNVQTGKIRVFSGVEISTDAILASACLPTIFQAVELPDPETGGMEAYWDGGYTGNPALFPLYAPDLPDDIVVVSINPQQREGLPRSAQDILDRINEISFNASLLGELRAIRFAKRLIAEGRMEKGAMKDVLLHLIADDGLMNRLNARSKLAPHPGLLWELKAAGRAAADDFLARHGDKLNRESSVDPGLLIA